MGVHMALKSLKIKGLLQKLWHTDPKLWHTNPPFSAKGTVFIGGGGGLQFVEICEWSTGGRGEICQI